MPQSARHVVALLILPQAYNPDEQGRRLAVEDEKFRLTVEEIARRFGGGVLWKFTEAPPQGYWWDRGFLHQDELVAIEVDIPDTRVARSWLRRYAREVLLRRFKQEAIYIRLIGPVQVVLVTAR